jgi:transcriptional regulator with XRE-family HTH domain
VKTLSALDPTVLPHPGGHGLEAGLAFGKVLKELRKQAGLTQEQLALEADIQRNYVSLIERGINQPTITIIFKLAAGLKCKPSALISEVESLVEQSQ